MYFRQLSICVLLAGLIFTPLGYAAAKPAVDTTIDLDRGAIKAGDGGVVYVLVRLRVPETPVDQSKPRPPLNIALVLDRSGSMAAKGKIKFLKAAAKSVIDRLGGSDRLALVEYDDRITVAWPSSPVEAPDMVKRIVDGLKPRGSTNLAGGMFEGINQVLSHHDEEAVNRVLLLSDGLANAGLTDPLKIRQALMSSELRGVPVTALGLGIDYNEDLMQAIAEHSGGAYYYIESPTQMASVFQRELSSLFRTAASDLEFRFAPGPAIAGIQVFGYASRTQGGATIVDLPALYSGESRSIVLRLDVKSQNPGRIALGQMVLAYKDVASGERVEHSEELTLVASDDDDVIVQAANREATVEAMLAEAEARHGDALALAQKGQWKSAQEHIAATVAELNDVNMKLKDARIATKMEAMRIEQRKVAESAAAPSSARAKQFMKRSKLRLYQAYQGKRSGYVFKPGDTGHGVERLQQALAKIGYYKGAIDGTYSKTVEQAVAQYQSDNQLKADGIAGPATLDRLKLY